MHEALKDLEEKASRYGSVSASSITPVSLHEDKKLLFKTTTQTFPR